MSTGAIAKRYARALLSYATERGEAQRVYDQAEHFTTAYFAVPALREMLLSPIKGSKERIEVVIKAVGSPLCPSLEHFVRLVMRHHREHHLHFMLHSYLRLYKEQQGLHEGLLEVAYPLSEEQLARLKGALRSVTGGELSLREEVEESLVGGFRLRIDDLQIDNSLRNRLERLKRHYSENSNRIV